MARKAKSIDAIPYTITGGALDTDYENSIISKALEILANRVNSGPLFDSPQTVRHYLTVRNGAESDANVERFSVLFLDSQNRLISCETMFTGTLTQTSVYPREVVRRALAHNAAAVVFSHNHPSGVARPSRADETLTQSLKAALSLVDVRTLDHFIVAGAQCVSMAEIGLV